MIAALLITLSLAAPTTLTGHDRDRSSSTSVTKEKAAKAKAAPQLAQARLAPDPNAPGADLGFVDHYLPFSLAAQALPAVKDNLVLSHVLGYLLPCGGLWGPVVLIDGAEFSGDVIISWLLSSIIWFVAIAVVGTITIGVGYLAFLALPYLATTATLNAVDRGLKAKGYTPPPKGTTPNPSNPANPPTGDTPPPSYAY